MNNPDPVPLSLFSYDRFLKTLAVDISSIPAEDGGPVFIAPVNGRPRKCLDVRSGTTGRTFRFWERSTLHVGAENEISGWAYSPVDPECPIVALTIWND